MPAASCASSTPVRWQCRNHRRRATRHHRHVAQRPLVRRNGRARRRTALGQLCGRKQLSVAQPGQGLAGKDAQRRTENRRQDHPCPRRIPVQTPAHGRRPTAFPAGLAARRLDFRRIGLNPRHWLVLGWRARHFDRHQRRAATAGADFRQRCRADLRVGRGRRGAGRTGHRRGADGNRLQLLSLHCSYRERGQGNDR